MMARAIERLARMLALLGGLVLVALTIITCISIAGRALISFGLGPVPGDFELVEAGVAFAIFAFLPWCQLNRGHATVDLFTSFLSERTNRWSCRRRSRSCPKASPEMGKGGTAQQVWRARGGGTREREREGGAQGGESER